MTQADFSLKVLLLTEEEWENARLKQLQVNERLNFVPVPGTEHLNTLVEDELNTIDKLSEADLEAMVERTFNSQAVSQNIAASVTQSVVSSFPN